VLAAAVALTGCSGGGSGGGSEDEQSADPSLTASPSESPTKTKKPEPKPTRYSDKELVQALPQGVKEMHGITDVSDECRNLSVPCHGTKGTGLVDARSDPDQVDLLVVVNRNHDEAVQRKHRQECRPGTFDRQVEWLDDDHTSYVPGERGRARQSSFKAGEWEGFLCEKQGVLLYPDGHASDHHRWQYAYLSNGLHDLTTAARTPKMTKALAREYAERLERADKGGNKPANERSDK
jgi:hypothetical protein